MSGQRPNPQHKQAGFTLIELLVTTVISAMILLTASSILMTFFVSNSRTTLRRQIKAEGSRALSRIEFIARGAESCTQEGTDTITFTNVDGTGYKFYKNNDNLTMQKLNADGSNSGSPENLLTNFVIAKAANFWLRCQTVALTTKQYADVRFDVTSAETSTVSETFTSLTALRNSK